MKISCNRYENGLVLPKEEGTCRLLLPEHCWERSMLPSLHDVSVASSDGATFKAHKCVLAARLEYFNSMFTGGWVEVNSLMTSFLFLSTDCRDSFLIFDAQLSVNKD